MLSSVRSGAGRLVAAILVGLAFVLPACAGGAGGTQGGAGRKSDVIVQMRARHDAAGGSRPFDSIGRLLSNTEYKMPGDPARPLTEAVVIGEVVDVVPGRGFRVEGNDAPGGLETEFDDPRALWRTVHVSVQVDTLLSGAVKESPVVVGFAFDPSTSFEDVEEQFRSIGEVLLFLNRSPVFAYDDLVYGTVMDGALLGVIGEDDNIQLPVLENDEEAGLLKGASTLEQLRAAGQEPHQVIQLDASGVPVSE